MSDGGRIDSKDVRPDGQASGLSRPHFIALILGGVYLVFCSFYIWISGQLAAQHSASVEELEHLETIKGMIFVLVCAVLITGLSWWLLRRLAREQEQRTRDRQALITTERRAMAGSLASSVAHDMNNILTVGCASSEMLLHTKGLDADQLEYINDINDSFKRMMELARRLSTMGRAGTKGDLQLNDLRQVVEQELAFARRLPRLEHCQLVLTATEAIPMRLNAPMMQHMLLNLLLNAAEAMQSKGRIEVRLARERSAAVLEVHDSGPGIPVDQRERVFDPFFTTKPEGQGLGLLSVKAAAQMHRGRVVVIESPLGGACFRVTMPMEVSPT